MSKKLLVIQFRTDASKPHEQECFIEDLHHHKHRMEFRSAVDMDFPKDLAPYAGVVFAGSGEFMWGQGAGEGTWKLPTFRFVDRVLQKEIPMLGICFGYQMLALHQGAKIVDTEELRETGTFDMYVSDHGKTDPLFDAVPASFKAQFGHKETVVDKPKHLIPLAYTQRVASNSFRLEGANVWGTLSHPELNPQRMRTRVELFPVYRNGKSLEEVLQAFSDSPHAHRILLNFVDRLEWE